MQDTGAFLGVGALFSRATGGRGGAGGRGGGGSGGGGLAGLGAGLGIGRSADTDDWRGQYASVPIHSRQNSVAPLMGNHD